VSHQVSPDGNAAKETGNPKIDSTSFSAAVLDKIILFS
jgi:hypothetical protein